MTKDGHDHTRDRHDGWKPALIGAVSATLLVVGFATDHGYGPLLFAAAPIVAIAGLIVAAVAVCQPDSRAGLATLIGGGLSLLVLLGFAYALLAYGGGGN